MNEKMSKLVHEIEKVRKSESPVITAWIEGCNRIGLDSSSPIVTFGKMFAEHPDLKNSDNAYHNHLHAADAVTCASILAKEEFNNKEIKINGPLMLFSMLCHDIAHTGENNQFDYQLEKEAVSSMQNFINNNPELKNYWNKNIKDDFGSWEKFSNAVETIILGTDFKNGPKENYKTYNDDDDNIYKINKLKLLANEADILPSCISSLGPELGKKLSEEQNNPGVASWKGREFFIGKLATFGSKASQELGVQEHINKQLEVISKYGAKKIDEESNPKIKIGFNLDALKEMRAAMINKPSSYRI